MASKTLRLAVSVAAVSAIDVPTVDLGDGVRMPMLAFGTFRGSFRGKCSVAEAARQWLELGGRHIDTVSVGGVGGSGRLLLGQGPHLGSHHGTANPDC